MCPSIERSDDRLAHSAKKLERSSARVEESADRRTELAANRTVFAAERTYAAWVRTGLLALASGIGAKALFTEPIPEWFGTVSGTVLVPFAAFWFVAGVWRHLNPGAPPPAPDVARVSPAAMIAMNGFLALVAGVTLVGLWLGHAAE